MNSKGEQLDQFAQTARISIAPAGGDEKQDADVFRLAFDCAADAMFINSLDGAILEANQAACQWLGYSVEEFRKMRSVEFDVGVDVPALFKIILNKRELRFETIWAARNGTRVPVEMYSRVARIGDTKLILSIARDIRERKAAETMQRNAQAELERRVAERTEELQHANRRLQSEVLERKSTEFEFRTLFNFNETLLSALDALVIAIDSRGHIVRFNEACEKLSGWRCEDVIGRCYWDVLVPEDRREAARQDIERVAAGATGLSTESEWITRSGIRKWITWIHSVMFDQRGQVELVISSGFNTTERRNLEEKIRLSERKYRTLYENMQDGFAVVDMTGLLVEFNESFRAMLGYTAEELYALTYEAITPTKWHALESEILATQILTRGYSDIYRKEYRRKDGTVIPIELRTILQRDDAQQPSVMWAIIRDLSQTYNPA